MPSSNYGGLGAAAAVGLSSAGAAIGTAQAASALFDIGFQWSKDMQENKAIVPVVMSGVLALYGLIIGVKLALHSKPGQPLLLGAGLTCGLANLASGACIGAIAKAGILAYGEDPSRPRFVGLVLILIFAESIGLYGLIVALFLEGRAVTAKVKTS